MVINRTAYRIVEVINQWHDGQASFEKMAGILGVDSRKLKIQLDLDGVVNHLGEPDPVLSKGDLQFFLLWHFLLMLARRTKPTQPVSKGHSI